MTGTRGLTQPGVQSCPVSPNKSGLPEPIKGPIRPEAHLSHAKAGKMGGSPGLVELRWRKVGVKRDPKEG